METVTGRTFDAADEVRDARQEHESRSSTSGRCEGGKGRTFPAGLALVRVHQAGWSAATAARPITWA